MAVSAVWHWEDLFRRDTYAILIQFIRVCNSAMQDDPIHQSIVRFRMNNYWYRLIEGLTRTDSIRVVSIVCRHFCGPIIWPRWATKLLLRHQLLDTGGLEVRPYCLSPVKRGFESEVIHKIRMLDRCLKANLNCHPGRQRREFDYQTAGNQGCNWVLHMVDGCNLELCDSYTSTGIASQK